MPWQSSPVETGAQPLRVQDSAIRLVWVTDSHLVADPTEARSVNLLKAIEDCNTWRPNLFVHTGDVSNNSLSALKNSGYIWRLAQRPAIIVPGNHDEIETAPGVTNYSEIIGVTAFGRNPLYYATTAESGDGTLKALCIVLDLNYYDNDPDEAPPGNSDTYNPGDRWGYAVGESAWWRMMPAGQLAWLEATLAADDSDIVLVFAHYSITHYMTNAKAIADVLQADGRPTILFAGHKHEDAMIYTLTTTDAAKTYQQYKAPAMQESGCWVRMTLSLSGGAISIDEAVLHNFTNPGGWTVSAPFTVAE